MSFIGHLLHIISSFVKKTLV